VVIAMHSSIALLERWSSTVELLIDMICSYH